MPVTKAVILAAGVGARLGDMADKRPKALLRFGGKSLLQRHIECLARNGVTNIVVGVGYRADAIAAEIASLAGAPSVRTIQNDRYRDGSVVTLWALRHELASGEDILLMDADVLYDDRVIGRLVGSAHANCFLLDRDIEPGDEPVKLCVRAGRPVEFRKRVEGAFDFHGESVGFFRFAPNAARDLAARVDDYVASGRLAEPYEEAVRDLLLAGPADRFGYEDVTGLPWIEIDFPDDAIRAESEILPLISII